MALDNFKNGQLLDEIALNKVVAEINSKATNTKATVEVDGLMSKEDKKKLNGLNNYVHPDGGGSKHIPFGGESGQILRWSSAGTAEWGNDKDTTYSQATENELGLVKKMATQPNSEATDVQGLVADFNALLAKLKSAGLMS